MPRFWLPLIPVLGALTIFVSTTTSFFSNVESSLGNVLAAASAYPTPTPGAQAIAPLSILQALPPVETLVVEEEIKLADEKVLGATESASPSGELETE